MRLKDSHSPVLVASLRERPGRQASGCRAGGARGAEIILVEVVVTDVCGEKRRIDLDRMVCCHRAHHMIA